MAITFGSLLASLRTTAGATSYLCPASGTFTPSATALLVVAVEWSRAAMVNVPTLSGGGLTWSPLQDQLNYSTIALPNKAMGWWWAATGSTPAAMTVTADFAGETETGCAIDVFDLPGAHLTTPRVQAAQNASNAAITLSATLAAGVASTSATVAIGGSSGVAGLDPRSGWTEINDGSYAAPNTTLATQYRLATSEATGQIDKTGGGATVELALIVVEFQAAAGVPAGHPAIRRLGGIPGASRMRNNPRVRIF